MHAGGNGLSTAQGVCSFTKRYVRTESGDNAIVTLGNVSTAIFCIVLCVRGDTVDCECHAVALLARTYYFYCTAVFGAALECHQDALQP